MKNYNPADAEVTLVHSPLCQRITRDGTEVSIQIYGDGNGGWLLEIVDEFGTSTVWDDSFATDQEAFAEALEAMDELVSQIRSPLPLSTNQNVLTMPTPSKR